MRSSIIQIIKTRFKSLYFIIRFFKILPSFFGSKSFIIKSGYFNSLILDTPADHLNNPIPWMNYSLIHFLKERINTSHNLFEYGSGFSTLFFSKISKQITSVEYDEQWAKVTQELLKNTENTNILHIPYESISYSTSARDTGFKFDIIIVDGRNRVACVKESVEALSNEGVIILDDSERDRYSAAFDIMEKSGFKNISFYGPKPGAFIPSQSTIFYRTNNCLGI